LKWHRASIGIRDATRPTHVTSRGVHAA